MNLSQQILNKIQDEQIKPRSRYAFLLSHSVYWVLVVILLILGAVSASIAIFSLANTEWDLWAKAAGSGWYYFLIVLPYLWLIFFGGFIALAHFNLRHTRLGYRFSLFRAVVVFLSITIVVGSGLYWLGFGEKIEEKIAESTPYYYHLQGGRIIWDKPEKGMLGGKIIETVEPQRFILVDQSGFSWQVTVSGTNGSPYEYIGSKIKMLGQLVGTSSFQAVEIRSWCGCGGCQQMNAPCSNNNGVCPISATCSDCGF